MIHFKRKNLAGLLILLFGLLGMACQPEQSAQKNDEKLRSQLEGQTNSFFSDEVLDSDDAADVDVPCAGATPEESQDLNHPQIIRGSVVAPRKIASFGLPFIKQAHAVPIADEFPVAKTTIKLMRGINDPKTIAETQTDAIGRFCLKLSWAKSFDENYYLQAEIGDEILRRLAPTQKTAIVSTQSEAVFRLYKERFQALVGKRSVAINLQTVADTQVDTFNPLRAKPSIEESVDLVLESLKGDPRIRKILTLE